MSTPILTDGAGILDITLVKGIKFSRTLTRKISGVPVDFTGYTFLGKIFQNDGVTVLATFTINGIDIVHGKIQLYLSSANTLAIPEGAWDYFIEATEPDTDSFLLLKGKAITRSR